jgi:hypothetical protein
MHSSSLPGSDVSLAIPSHWHLMSTPGGSFPTNIDPDNPSPPHHKSLEAVLLNQPSIALLSLVPPIFLLVPAINNCQAWPSTH